MKSTTLLNDILTEGDYAEFRETVAARVQSEARRKRVASSSQWLALAAAVAIAVSSFFVAPKKKLQPAVAKAAPEAAYVLRTTALAESQILVTRAVSIAEITTDHSKMLPSISDAELLELFPHHATALAAIGRAPKQFFFINPKDAAKFMASN